MPEQALYTLLESGPDKQPLLFDKFRRALRNRQLLECIAYELVLKERIKAGEMLA